MPSLDHLPKASLARTIAVVILLTAAMETAYMLLAPASFKSSWLGALVNGAATSSFVGVFLYLWLRREEAARKTAEESTALLKELAYHVLDAEDSRAALEFALRRICEITGWVLGEAWLPSADGSQLEFYSAWTSREEELKPFLEASRGKRFLPGEGLPGRVWASGKPAWIEDVTLDANFPRAAQAKAVGLRGAMGVPITAEGRVVAVLDFFVYEPRPKVDPRLVSLVAAAAAQLGAFLRRKLADDRFRQSQKMEALGLLAGGVAHDFNNLLTLILCYNDFVLGSLEEGSPLRRYSESVRTASRNAASLTRQLLSFSRRHAVVARNVDLSALAGDSCRMLKRLVGDSIELAYLPTPEPCMVRADPSQLEQVLLNLVVNARDAMPKGGRLTVAVSQPASSRDHVLLCVRDTGAGMSRTVRERIFEPFFTTKEPGHGTGLGLSTVDGIVKGAGGSIEVDSEPDRGTEFRVFLPRVHGPAEERDSLERGTPRKGRGRILLAEDDDDLREVLRQALAEGGYEVLEASRGDEALRLAESRSEDIDLLLTDVMLPGLDGLSTAEEFARRRPASKVLFMSGFADIGRNRELPSGTALLEKPFSPQSLLLEVEKALDGPV